MFDDSTDPQYPSLYDGIGATGPEHREHGDRRGTEGTFIGQVPLFMLQHLMRASIEVTGPSGHTARFTQGTDVERGVCRTRFCGADHVLPMLTQRTLISNCLFIDTKSCRDFVF